MLEQTEPRLDSYQKTAFVFESRMREARSNHDAAIVFSRIVPHAAGSKKETKKQALSYLRGTTQETSFLPHEQILLNKIRGHLRGEDQEYLDKKKDNFTKKDKVRLLFKAKSKYLSRLNKDEELNMYKEAGYSEEEINKITGKKLLMAAGIGTAMAAGEQLGRGAATVNEKLVPFIDSIPPNLTPYAAGAAILLEAGSYAALTTVNLQLTKEHGTSANVTVTGLYSLADKLFPNKARDLLSVGIPIASNSVLYSFLYPLLTQGLTGDPHKIIAGASVATALNLTYTTAYLATNFVKERRSSP